NHSSSKKLVLSLVAISFLSSYSYANNSNVKAYSGANSKSRSASVYSSQASSNTTISGSQTSTQTITGANNTLVVESSGSVTISNPTSGGNKNKQAILFQP
ncbi:TPA: autotransporter, partial [Campylobacter jejuni]|nr:autotransporter [Campylobacter jejuni]